MNNEQGISNYEVFLSSFCFAVFTLITKIEISVLRDQIFSYPSTFIIPCSIFDIGIPVKNIKNNLALMGCPPQYLQYHPAMRSYRDHLLTFLFIFHIPYSIPSRAWGTL